MAKKTGRRIVIDDSSDNVAIRVSGVSKSFRLPHNRQNSIKGSLVNLIGGGDRSYETQEVLKDISFEIKKGEFFGIVGRNGSGKSTLLKMLAGIYKPTAGEITVNGSLTPFIELGVGFNPELTGRENVYMNGALLGFNDKEVDAMYDDIVEFAELERFMDQKLKNYSSGMQVRLAFSIAIKSKAAILIFDEVLAVGDSAFQEKCNRYFEELKEKGHTIVLVTHDMNAVRQFCDRSILVSEGEIIHTESNYETANKYEMINYGSIETGKILEQQERELPIKIALQDMSGKEVNTIQTGKKLKVVVEWDDSQKIEGIGVIIYKNKEVVFATNSLARKKGPKRNNIELTLDMNLGNGRYKVRVGIFSSAKSKTPKGIFGDETISVYGAPRFNVDGDVVEGVVELRTEWEIN